MTETAIEKLQTARAQLVIDYPFFGILALKFKLIEAPDGGGAGTCGVDIDKNFYYNPDFIDQLSLRDTAIVMCHEIGHLVQSCHARFPAGGNRQLWNIAADFAVNSWVVETNLCKQPNILDEIFAGNIATKDPNAPPGQKGFIASDQSVREYAKDKSTEEMYLDMLREEIEPPKVKCYWQGSGCDGDGGGQGQGEGQGDNEDQQGNGGGSNGDDSGKHHANGLGCNAGSQTKNPTPRQLRELKEDIQGAAIAARDRANGRGDLPGFIEEFLARISKPTVTWKDHLRRSATQSFRGRYAWNRPSRRSSAIGMRLPARKPTPKGAIIALDTSGSISDKMLAQFLSECVGIMKAAQCPWVDIYLHDTEVYDIQSFSARSITNIKVKRGGTSHIDVFEQIEKSNKKIGMVVAFTDLMSVFPNEPAYPVVWAVPTMYKDHNHPWGKKVEVVLPGEW